jgi:voltage-gated potassium channel
MTMQTVRGARAELARRIEHWLELPMALLGALWLLLLVDELTRGVTPLSDAASTAIWLAFLVEFAIRLALAPQRRRFLRRNWVTVLSLALPAVRVLRVGRLVRVLRLGRAARTLRVARLLTSFNRGMRTLGTTMRRRGFPYVLALTFLVLILGAAGIYTFERDAGNRAGFDSFGASLWWTAMLLTTMGSEYWPRTTEGRVICLLLSIYAFAVFGYLTATLASYFVDSDAAAQRAHTERVEQEVRAVRAQVQRQFEAGAPPPP